MTNSCLPYEFLHLADDKNEIRDLRHEAIVSMRFLKIAASSTYQTPKNNDPDVLHSFNFSKECAAYSKFCEERLREPLSRCLRSRGLALRDNEPEAIYLLRLDSPSVFWPTEDEKYANVLVPMFDTVYKTKLQGHTGREVIDWDPNTPIFFHNIGMMVPHGQLHYLHYLYPVSRDDVIQVVTGPGWASVTFQS